MKPVHKMKMGNRSFDNSFVCIAVFAKKVEIFLFQRSDHLCTVHALQFSCTKKVYVQLKQDLWCYLNYLFVGQHLYSS